MGDIRHDHAFEAIRDSKDRVGTIASLSDLQVLAALGGATRDRDLLLTNILATEAQNRVERATRLTTSIGEGVVAMDETWRIAMGNPAAERMLGWTSAELTGAELHPLIHPFCKRPEECHLGTLPPKDFFYQNDDALVMRKDGRTIRVAYTVTPMMKGDEVRGGVVLFRDSSERKRLEEKASQRQDRLQTILQTLAEGILILDLDGRITYANAAAERILGRAARDITERTYYDPAWDFVRENGDVLPVTELPFSQSLDTGQAVIDAKLGVRRGDDTIAYLNVNVVPLPDANRRPYALLVSFLEINA